MTHCPWLIRGWMTETSRPPHVISARPAGGWTGVIRRRPVTSTSAMVPLSLCRGPSPSAVPQTSAVVGPCSPAAALWLALGFLDAAGLPEFGAAEDMVGSSVTPARGPPAVPPPGALFLTAPEPSFWPKARVAS